MLAAACAAWCAASASTVLWAALRGERVARPAPSLSRPPPVLLLRPCAGDERHLARALRSSRVAPRRSAVRLLVAQEDDPALPCARETCDALVSEDLDARVVVTHAQGPNRKADQIARALASEGATHAFVVVADSDVELEPESIAALLAPITARDVDATWSPPVEVAPVTRADAASGGVLDASLHAFALLGALDPQGMVGKLLAVRRDALDRAGGFAPLASYLGEDMELARRLGAVGAYVGFTRTSARSLASGRTWREAARRYARWVTVIRAQRPWLLASYPLLLAAAPLQLALALVATALEGIGGVADVAVVLVTRAFVALLARAASGGSLRGAIRAGWAADGLLLVAWSLAMASRGFAWRGVPMRVERGRLVEGAPR